MNDYPVTQTVTIELYGLTMEVTGYIEPSQIGGRVDPSWDAYWVSQKVTFDADDIDEKLFVEFAESVTQQDIDDEVLRVLKDIDDNGPLEE
jgi:hypothetical protein